MLSVLILTLLYFLPSILGKDKRDAMGIFLVNLFLGWTLIGWVVAFLWAIAAERSGPVVYATAGGSRYCSHCGTPAVPVVQYCGSCGARV
jgi:Superinfection immunity protein/zinc-ribbon domain